MPHLSPLHQQKIFLAIKVSCFMWSMIMSHISHYICELSSKFICLFISVIQKTKLDFSSLSIIVTSVQCCQVSILQGQITFTMFALGFRIPAWEDLTSRVKPALYPWPMPDYPNVRWPTNLHVPLICRLYNMFEKTCRVK